MDNRLVNDGTASTYAGIPTYYNSSYSSAGITDLSFQVFAPAGFANYNPPGTLIAEYYDPYQSSVVTKVFYVGELKVRPPSN